jgi:acyl carrier protein
MSTPPSGVPSTLKEIFSRVLRVSEDKITLDSSPKTTRSWDSLRHVELVLEVEEAYGVSFTPTEIFALSSVQGFCEMLLKKKAASQSSEAHEQPESTQPGGH